MKTEARFRRDWKRRDLRLDVFERNCGKSEASQLLRFLDSTTIFLPVFRQLQSTAGELVIAIIWALRYLLGLIPALV